MRKRRTGDPRVIGGVFLMVLATALAGVVLQRASQRLTAWQVGHGMAAGTRLAASDVHVAEVAVDGVGVVYASTREAIVGRVLMRDLAAGELVPRSALGRRDLDHDRVTVPIEPLHLPPGLRRGQRVDVWRTGHDEHGQIVDTTRLLEQVLVDAVSGADVGGRTGVVLSVPRSAVATLVAGMRTGDLDLVGVGSAL